MIMHFTRLLAEGIHRTLGRFLNDALDEMHLAEMVDDDGSQDPSWYPEISGVDNGWPRTLESAKP